MNFFFLIQQVEMVVVDEDCSRIGNEVPGAGCRGMCGSTFVYKVIHSRQIQIRTHYNGYVVVN